MGKDSLIKSTTPKKRKAAAAPKSKSNKMPTPTKKRGSKKSAPTKRELIFKTFDSQQWPKAATPQPSPASRPESAPPPNDVSVMDNATRKLIFKRFSMVDIRSAAKTSHTADAIPEKVPGAQTAYQVCDNSAPSLPAPHFGVSDPVIRSMSLGLAALVLILILISGASIRNHSKYFMVARRDAVEIWRGRFSPTGKEFYSILHNYRLTEPGKPSYSKQEIYPVMFNYYIQKADKVLESENLPDFLTIHQYLTAASQYALTDQMRHAVLLRMNAIEQATFLYKADVAINRGTPRSLELAIRYLRNARALTHSSVQSQIIDERIAMVQSQLSTMEKPSSENKNRTKPPAPMNTPEQ